MIDELNESINKLKKVIHTTQTTYSIAEILSLYRDNELILRPQYQRFFRWSPLQKAKLIESILLDIPMPIFFVYSTSEGAFEVIDGLQRLSTIFEFIAQPITEGPKSFLRDENDNFKEALKLNLTESKLEFENLGWHDLGIELQRKFKQYRLVLSVIKDTSQEDTKYDLFQRLNSGGTPLSGQESRNCLMIMLKDGLYEFISGLTKSSESFTEMIDISENQKYQSYPDQLATWFSALFIYDVYSGNKNQNSEEYLDAVIKNYFREIIRHKTNIEACFTFTMRTLNKLKGKEAFKTLSSKGVESGAFNLTCFIALSLYFISIYKKSNNAVPEIDQGILEKNIQTIKEFVKSKPRGIRTIAFIAEINRKANEFC
ncbi:MAG: DUF262 domain-containing protein [bacterium]